MEQRNYQDFTGMFPRPGKALKALLITIVVVSISSAIVVNWLPGPPLGPALWHLLVCSRSALEHWFLWTLVTGGLCTMPSGDRAVTHVFFTLLGLYFFSPDLERRWGPWRFLRFVAISNAVGFLLGFVIDVLAPPQLEIFHPGIMYGASAAITATTVAWSRQNANAHFRLFFLLPMKGSWLFWLAVAYCVLGVVYWDARDSSGAVAPFGGLITGLLLGGSPSALRTIYLRMKLAVLRKQAGPSGRAIPKPSRSRQGGPPLRVLSGGVEDDLKKRKPPKDKRYLN